MRRTVLSLAYPIYNSDLMDVVPLLLRLRLG